ncbi:hypothetical protein EMCRGX_G028988 [Ephydatia muelleri]
MIEVTNGWFQVSATASLSIASVTQKATKAFELLCRQSQFTGCGVDNNAQEGQVRAPGFELSNAEQHSTVPGAPSTTKSSK